MTNRRTHTGPGSSLGSAPGSPKIDPLPKPHPTEVLVGQGVAKAEKTTCPEKPIDPERPTHSTTHPAAIPPLTITGPIFRGKSARQPTFTEDPTEPSDPTDQPARHNPGPTGAAMTLALGHEIVRKIESGELTDLAHAARVLHVSRARITQIVDLTLLKPRVQEEIVLGNTSNALEAMGVKPP